MVLNLLALCHFCIIAIIQIAKYPVAPVLENFKDVWNPLRSFRLAMA